MIKKNISYLGEKFVFGDKALGEIDLDLFNELKFYKTDIPKKVLLSHLESLELTAATAHIEYDLFTKEIISNCGFCLDGDFIIPNDLKYYIRKYDIGIPPEYEEYLKNIL